MTGPTPMIARETELDRALYSLRFSGGVMITGAAGLGKTMLAATAAERLANPPVAWVVATAASRTTPLGALSGLLPPDLATIHPALVAQHVSTRLRELSRTDQRSNVPPVIVVDDTQLLDAQSSAVLLSLVTAKSLRLLATLRVGDTPSDAVTALWKEGLVDRLDLEPLDRAASKRLLESQLSGPVSTGTLETLWQSSHGNPFYLSELARFGADHGQLELKAGSGGGSAGRRCRHGSVSCCNAGSTPCRMTPGRPSTSSHSGSRCRTRPSPRWSARTPSWRWTAARSSPATSRTACFGCASPTRCCTPWPSGS